jgi:hypothetical protein
LLETEKEQRFVDDSCLIMTVMLQIRQPGHIPCWVVQQQQPSASAARVQVLPRQGQDQPEVRSFYKKARVSAAKAGSDVM